jgi:FixJ family two-component response regulator
MHPLISVVDDDHSIRQSLSSLLRSVGLLVAVFSSAEEFLVAGDLDQTACLILDVRMPGMGGLELQRRLARSHPHLPVVFITAHGSEDAVRERALKDGAVGYLTKPLSEETLLDAVQVALGKN